MKRIFFSLLIMSAGAAHAQEADPKPTEATDTVISISDPSKVIISETPEGVFMTVMGADSTMTFAYRHPDPGNVDISTSKASAIGNGHSVAITINSWDKANKTKYDLITGGLSFGKNFAFDQPTPMDITTGKSWEISWMYILGLRISNGGNSFRTGLGLNWRNYKLTGPYQFVKADGAVSLSPYPDKAYGEWSRLKITTLSIPLLYSRHIWKSLNVAVGGIVNFATHSSIKSRFMFEEREITTSQSGIYPRPVTVDIYGAVTVWGIGWYVRYSPMNALRTDRGPQFTSLSTGIVLGL